MDFAGAGVRTRGFDGQGTNRRFASRFSGPAIAIRRGEPDLIEHEDSAFIAAFRGPSSAPIGDTAPTDTDDDLKPARGLVNGVLISVPLWVVIVALTWLFLAW